MESDVFAPQPAHTLELNTAFVPRLQFTEQQFLLFNF